MTRCINLERDKKSTNPYEIEITNKSTGLAEDITGWTFYFYIKVNMNDADESAKLKKKITDLTEPLSGKTLIPFLASDTDFDAGSYYYSLDYKTDDSPANQGTLIKGRIKLNETLIKDRD